MRRPLNVLVVDDSAVVRQVLSAILSEDPAISVSVAADPIFAMQKMSVRRPDVIILDIAMPRMDGITFLRKITSESSIPVVICSALTGDNTIASLQALNEGAVDVINKPRLGTKRFLQESAVVLLDTVWAAAPSKLRQAMRQTRRTAVDDHSADVILPPAGSDVLSPTADKLIAIGASTGGPEALKSILAVMPPDCHGMVIVQHMPEMFTSAFAIRLNECCAIDVKEAETGDRVTPGRALIAPGDRHTLVRRIEDGYVVKVVGGPLVSRHRPSVNVLFRSVAQTAGPNAVGVILTGMGHDGAAGLLEMKRAGSATIAQDEATSAVFGMPKEAISRGAVDRVLPLAKIPAEIIERAKVLAP